MGTVRRRSRHRTPELPLQTHWDAGEPPPAWAFQPGEHNDQLRGFYFFNEGGRAAIDHPHRDEWFAALQASDPRA